MLKCEGDMNKTIEEKMFDMAVAFIKQRYPNDWGGAAVVRTVDDDYYISVAPDTFNPSVEICIETGAYCEAHKYNKKVSHSLCVVRNDEQSPFKVLTPCGVCQERLQFWGEDVLVGVTSKEDKLKFVRLGLLQPYHWTKAYKEEDIIRFKASEG